LSLKIHWQIEDEQGVVPLRGGQAWVVHVDGLLDRLGRPPGEGEDGFTAGESDDRLALEATGDLSFVVGGKRGRKVLLPSGGQVEFEIAETVGTLRVSGETSAADPMVGREIGGFRLLGRLGSGAVGAVYRALQTSLDREVALKVLHPEASKDPVKVASFRGEAVAAGRLSHPNLVQVFDVADEGELHFFAMELVPGGTLEDKLRESGPLPWREAVLALRDTAQALSFAEAHELVHRDVKPENLMVTASGHVKLADLGLAATRGMIDQEAAGGTPHFMAPESIRPENVDHRSDLYSLGCTLFRLLTADTVFHGDSVRDILRAHREEAPPSLREAEVAAPRELEELLASLLAKDPDARPASALAVVEACERILAHRKQRRGAGIALVVLLAAAGAWAVLGPKDEAVEPPTPAVTGPSEEDRQRAEEQRLQQEGQRAFTAAMAQTDGAAKADALRAFLDQHAGHGLAQTARTELEALERAAALAAAGPGDPAVPAAPSAAFTALAAEVAADLEAGRPGAALGRIDALPELAAETGALRVGAVQAAEAAVTAAEEAHTAQLAAEDWDGAAATLQTLAAALEGTSSAEAAGWVTRRRALEEAAAAAREAAAQRAFAEARAGLVGALRSGMDATVPQFDAAGADAAFLAALDACPHEGLRAAAEPWRAMTAAAARAEAALRDRLAGQGPFDLTEAVDGKRALLLGLDADGPRVQVQVRGERVERQDSWRLYLAPEHFGRFLDEAIPAEMSAVDAAALQLLVAAQRAAENLRRHGGVPPGGSAGVWADELRRSAELARPVPDPPEWLRRERAALEGLAAAAEALAADDPYSALVRLEDFLAGFSLTAALASDGGSDWGVAR
jgi:hypothetical protein